MAKAQRIEQPFHPRDLARVAVRRDRPVAVDDGAGGSRFQPHVTGFDIKVDPKSFRRIFTPKPSEIIPIGLFVSGQSYKLWGLFETDLHLIGPLQTNKVKEAVALFDVIQSLDRIKLADALALERGRSGRMPRLFVQVNTGEEAQKAGVPPREAGNLIAYARDMLKLPVEGLMCIPPADDDAAPHFALLLKLAREHGLPNLSMGMSGDFELAVRFGATHVRVGSAIFGARG